MIKLSFLISHHKQIPTTFLGIDHTTRNPQQPNYFTARTVFQAQNLNALIYTYKKSLDARQFLARARRSPAQTLLR